MSLPTRSSTTPADRRTTARPGTFRVLGDGESLSWSEPVFHLHGFVPGDVVPSTSLMLAHCHRDDRPALEAVLRSGRSRSGTPDAPRTPGEGRSVRYRLVDASGTERTVLAVLTADDVREGHAHGLLVDLGAEIGASAAQRADDMLAAAIASREVIDQAKGAAMLAYGLDGPAAFELLRWHSEHLNVKVRTLAERLLGVLPGRGAGTDPRTTIDAALADLDDQAGSPAGTAPRARATAGDDLPSTLDVRHVREGRTVVVSLSGEADGSTAPALVTGLAAAVRDVPPRGTLAVDASGLRRPGPVAALHVGRLRRRCEHAGITLLVVPPVEEWGGADGSEMRAVRPGASMGEQTA
jgi:hypothetical protein